MFRESNQRETPIKMQCKVGFCRFHIPYVHLSLPQDILFLENTGLQGIQSTLCNYKLWIVGKLFSKISLWGKMVTDLCCLVIVKNPSIREDVLGNFWWSWIGSVISLRTFSHLLFLDISCYEMCLYYLLYSEYTGPVVPLPSQESLIHWNV